MLLDYHLIRHTELIHQDQFEDFRKDPGVEHYKLLAYLSHQFNHSTFVEIGTHTGLSASCLSENPTNTLYTFDIVDKISNKDQLWVNRNVHFSTDNVLDPNQREVWKDTILSSAMIFIDIDPHEGRDEYQFYLWLKANNYLGWIIFDDIWYFKGMRDHLWYHIETPYKCDLTQLGHWSGTGLVSFRPLELQIYNKLPLRIPSTPSVNKSWTIVTAYFNLTKTADASPEIQERGLHHYVQHANMTMALDQNLVVYCDQESMPYLKSLRPVHLLPRTRFIVKEFADLDVVQKHYTTLVESRKRTGYNTDPRNTPSYYLFCMARYELLLETIGNNPFNSTHFAWCNICIERMGWKSGTMFPSIWGEYRDKFSTCYIDYQPKSLVMDRPHEYYQGGRCSMCSGFFTGNQQYMTAFCKRILEEFVAMLALDLGHADEQLFSIVYFKYPELFEFYLGDYSEMIINYGWIIDRPYEPVRNVLTNLSRSQENSKLLRDLCDRWLQSYYRGSFPIGEDDVEYIRRVQQTTDDINCIELIRVSPKK